MTTIDAMEQYNNETRKRIDARFRARIALELLGPIH